MVVVAASILGQGFHFGFSDTDAQWGKIHNYYFLKNILHCYLLRHLIMTLDATDPVKINYKVRFLF